VIGQHETCPAGSAVAGLFFACSIAISRAISLRPRPRPKLKPRVSKPAHDAALHFLARPKQYPLTDAERADLIQVVEGYTSPTTAKRPGAEWMREHRRRLGQASRF
jgi:hypothetical protein